MITAILTLAQPVVVVPVPPGPHEITREMFTKPIKQFECRMIGQSGPSFKLVTQIQGSQGYYSTSRPGKSDRIVSRTKTKFHIVEDGSERLASMRFTRFGKLIRIGAIFSDDSGSSAVLRHDYDYNLKSDKGTVSLFFFAGKAENPEYFAGPCTVKVIEQAPLDDDPNVESTK